ncbi:MAG: 4-(cytidine 5'-diphospho)-2-C-methyl-D-erythritol kinase [Ignavibacteriae bacterium]|nr:4-(cytidine 5'-diphospho)-2-C-methyl-D-erythritol kinase [Ignavibacteriota bacterium]
MILKTPAKINIGLKIIGRRDDGFHNIETIFCPVKLYDEIDIRLTPSQKDFNSIIIKSLKRTVPVNRNNTCVKAIELFFRSFSIREFFKIEILITKNIPVGGGLGGGSSDAGAVLKHLINYFKIDIKTDRKKILGTALAVGSDVPFFLIQKPCFASGRGENMRILKDFLPDFNILLVNPNQHVSTKWAYESLGLKPGEDYNGPVSVLGTTENFDISKPDNFSNDFEKTVFIRYPELARAKEELYEQGAVFASMSGSGAVLYGFFKKEDLSEIKSASSQFRSRNWFTHEC